MTQKLIEAYHQGSTDPKKKEKFEKINHDDTKSRMVFFDSYDIYNVPGNDLGPGAGFHSNMADYDSVGDFLNKKRKDKKRKKRLAFFEAVMIYKTATK